MTYHFSLADFPGAAFQLDTSPWTGRSALFKDGVLLEQAQEKGKPFLIPVSELDVVRAFPKPSFPDMVPILEINGAKHRVVAQLPWFEYTLGGLPVLLLFMGGALGGMIGVAGTMSSYLVFRRETLAKPIRYVAVIGIGLSCLLVYLLLAGLISNLMKR